MSSTSDDFFKIYNAFGFFLPPGFSKDTILTAILVN